MFVESKNLEFRTFAILFYSGKNSLKAFTHSYDEKKVHRKSASFFVFVHFYHLICRFRLIFSFSKLSFPYGLSSQEYAQKYLKNYIGLLSFDFKFFSKDPKLTKTQKKVRRMIRRLNQELLSGNQTVEISVSLNLGKRIASFNYVAMESDWLVLEYSKEILCTELNNIKENTLSTGNIRTGYINFQLIRRISNHDKVYCALPLSFTNMTETDMSIIYQHPTVKRGDEILES
ncbi:uncharacterized protein EV154DRAFT_482070 [Mucor mucedo]|uniref:uncharacterized protein n=1 Tax=Mucor mucedo TaxID=29922 RepID=UPI00221FCA6C|nr:uncharacterized protein EV154DRAFT_482070 [Mucor mucedo]KAI7890477.1 hypothetical protein EV154DRAFT_482070 [Mucor mucedo]